MSKDEAQFLNCVSLLCEVFEHLRLADGTVINVLAVPILEYCDLLLTSQSHQAVDLLGRQLQVAATRAGLHADIDLFLCTDYR